MHEPDTTDRLTEVARVLLEAASGIHAESHPTRAFAPGALLSLPAAAQRAGIDTGRPRYDDAIGELEYEGAIEWGKSARYARGTSTTSSPGAAWTTSDKARGARSEDPQRSNPEGNQKEDACRIEIVVRRQSCGRSGSNGEDTRG